MKKVKDIFSSKRGIAMELAVIVMLIAVAFGILLVTTSMLQNQKRLQARRELADKIAVMQILENIEAGEYDEITVITNEATKIVAQNKEGTYEVTVHIKEKKIESWSWEKVSNATE